MFWAQGLRAKRTRSLTRDDEQPKYINRLLETAELRKQDRLRAEDKMIAREREREGDEFADKDQFVTPAYLAQQEDLRKIEEEEKKREGMAFDRYRHARSGGLIMRIDLQRRNGPRRVRA